MYQLKAISKEAIPEATAKADWYRLLNEPGEAESICRDVLAVDREEQTALRLLGLAITDQFRGEPSDRRSEAESTFQRLQDPYERLYYIGIARERFAKALLAAGRAEHTLIVLFEDALTWFERAEKIRPAGNDEAILRWNRCVRILQSLSASDREQEHAHFEPTDSPPL
jgi:tetratricopeptide (TPR) repeat protein